MSAMTARPRFSNIVDALKAFSRGKYDTEPAFEPSPLPPAEREELQAIANYLDPVCMASTLSGMLQGLQAGVACGEILQEDAAHALEVARVYCELLYESAWTQSSAEYRLRLADMHQAREAGRKEVLEKKPRGPSKRRAGGGDAGD